MAAASGNFVACVRPMRDGHVDSGAARRQQQIGRGLRTAGECHTSYSRCQIPRTVRTHANLAAGRDRSTGGSSGGSSSPPAVPGGSGAVDLVIREVQPAEYWAEAEVHCASFYPTADFPLDAITKTDRVSSLLGYLGMLPGTQKKCFVAVTRTGDMEPTEEYDSEKSIPGGPILRPFFASFIVGIPQPSWFLRHVTGLHGVVGSVTVDNAAEFLPRKYPGRRRRQTMAYISNMAVRSTERRKGTARRLVRKAEEIAKSWGCRSIALHCNKENIAAICLYRKEGYKVVRPPLGAVWPKPWAEEGVELVLMLKLLTI